jgi:hypothetical protein
MRQSRSLALLVLLVLLGALAACSAGDADTTDSAAPEEGIGYDTSTQGSGLGATSGGAAERDDRATDDADTDSDGGGPGAVDEAPGQPPIPATTTVARPGERLIKEGTMTIEVPADGFQRAFSQVVDAARALGGSVVASTSSSSPDGGTAGSVTVRVPVDRYEDLLVGVGGIGEVRGQDITTKDVTGEFTDLQSRLRHARAQERFYLGLLEEAQSVNDAIAVQQQLDGIQSSIEQLQGRLTLLEDRTSFSTLTVALVEPGTSPVLAESERPRLAGYLATAQDAFVTVVGSLLVVVVALVPLLIPALVALLVLRGIRRQRTATVAARP